ncbi:MAG TPA: SGNH/GDSL hydrolase family protein [Conexibacter sp.]|jgi:lysophospholipase L1-like esterase|nr:SGNH/GDSL hydrolase family protein [Conexibacter sp.]
MRSRAATAATALALLALALLCGSAMGASGRYVALGDSYTAGPLIPNQSLNPLGCLRSDHNYSHLVQPSLTTAALSDVSCSGATTDDMFNAQSTEIGTNPPELDALTSGTRVVTLGIGGNDIGFSGIVLNCARLNPFDPCKDDYVHGSTDDVSVRIAATAPKVDAVIAAIHARAPSARVHVVGYPVILPASGSGCWPSVPILPTDVTYLRAKEIELNAMLASRAAADGAFYVDTYTSSVGHDVCKATGVKWVEGLIPTSPAAPVHPNALGMQNTARVTLARINAVGY